MLTLQRASAGSGKTYTLARSFIRMLISVKDEDGTTRLRRKSEIEDAAAHILAITFTNKATAEMKSRIIEKLADLAGRQATPDYLDDFMKEFGASEAQIRSLCALSLNALLNNYSDFQVSTIDSFFQTVLRTFAYEADLNDSYQVELDNAFLIDSGIDLTVRSLNEGTADKETRHWIERLMRDAADAGSHWNMFAAASGSRAGSLRKRLKEVVAEMEKEDFKRMSREFDAYFDETPDYSAVVDAYSERIGEPLRKACSDAVEAAKATKNAFIVHGLDMKADGAANLASHVAKTAAAADIFAPPDFRYEALQAKIGAADSAVLSAKAKKAGTNPEAVAAVAEAARRMYAAVDRWKEAAASDEALVWRLYTPTLPFPALMHRIRANVKEFLRDNNLVELSDTNTMLAKVIGDDDAPFIYERIGSYLEHYLIDEFQDTSALQWENIRPLLRESVSRSLDNLIIGDAKQSIYRFRNADPSLITAKVPAEFRAMPFTTAGASKEENTNHRSSRRIVEFNNTLFSLAAAHLDAADEALGMSGQDRSLAALYANVVQYPRRGEERDSGYVEITFMEPQADDGDDTGRFAHVGPLIDSLLDRGYRMAEIAVLVERNTDGAAVIDHLISYNARPEATRSIGFISDESLKIGMSRAVRIIVAALETVAAGAVTADDVPSPAKMHKSGAGALFALFIATHQDLATDEQIERFFNDPECRGRFASILSGMPAVTLPALVEAVAGELVSPALKRTDAAFIAAFQDCVIDYCRSYPADAASFVEWWKTKGSRLSINSPEGADAVRVMTIHKSKGLEFRCVILPSFSPSFGKTSQPGSAHDTFLWLPPVLDIPGMPPLPPLLPVKVDYRLMPASPLRDAFLGNLYGETMDSLNTAYVACTRAVDELYVFTRRPKEKKADKETLPPASRDFNRMALAFFSPESHGDYAAASADSAPWLVRPVLLAQDNAGTDGALRISYGLPEPDPAAYGKKTASNAVKAIEAGEYAPSPVLTRLSYKCRPGSSSSDGEGQKTDRRGLGNMMHDILSDMHTETDLHRAVRKRIVNGELTPEEGEAMEASLKDALASVRGYGWFAGGFETLNERSILADGQTRRPDRVMLSHGRCRAVVVDYKTGGLDEESHRKSIRSHCRQVEAYMRLLRRALPLESVEGYVWYISRSEVVPVKPAR